MQANYPAAGECNPKSLFATALGERVMADLPDRSEQLSAAQSQLIENKIANKRKSVALAYVLWFLFGPWGIYNFYLGKPRIATLQFTGGLLGGALFMIGGQWIDPSLLSAIGLVVLGVWILSFLADLLLIPGRAKAYSERLRHRYEQELLFRQT